jgi:hypothetical protein
LFVRFGVAHEAAARAVDIGIGGAAVFLVRFDFDVRGIVSALERADSPAE